MSIADKITEYKTRVEELNKFGKEVKNDLEKALSVEMLLLGAKLPKGYSIGNYEVQISSSSFYSVCLDMNLPKKENGKPTEEELMRLNRLLTPEFDRIKKEYGIEVYGFQYPEYI